MQTEPFSYPVHFMPDKNGVHHYPWPTSGFLSRMISYLPAKDQEEYWWLYRRHYLEGEQLSEKAQQRLGELGARARKLLDQSKGSTSITEQKLTEEEQAGYNAYIVWKRLSHNGRRSRDEMPPEAQAEYDAYGITEGSFWPEDLDHEQVKRLYEEAVAGSGA